jgi:hypothetical protein
MIDLIDYLIAAAQPESAVEIGGSIAFPVDLSAYDARVSLQDPRNEKVEAVARPPQESEDEKSVIYRVQFVDLRQPGFYELQLRRHSGETDSVLFASNIDPSEGRLQRLAPRQLESDFFSDKVSLIGADQMAAQSIAGGNTEVWPQVLWLLLAVLAVEQFLGWQFGRSR